MENHQCNPSSSQAHHQITSHRQARIYILSAFVNYRCQDPVPEGSAGEERTELAESPDAKAVV